MEYDGNSGQWREYMLLIEILLIIFDYLMLLVPLLLVFGGYLAFSILLFFFPTILHKKRKYKLQPFQQSLAGSRILRIAHRGGSRVGTQNTIQTFQKVEKYVDMLQMDVCVTKDQVLVVHHDQDLQRTCGLQKHIRDYTYQELPPFKKQIQLNFAPHNYHIDSNNQKMPTLQSVFKAFPSMPMNIQLKTPSKQAINQFVRLIRQYNRRSITFVGIRGPLQDQLRAQDLQGLRFMNDSQFYRLLLAFITGMLPYIYIEEASLQVPLYTDEFYQWKIRQWGNNWKTHAYFKGLKILNFVLQLLVSHLRKRGIMTFYWVCNYQNDFKRAVELGACGVMTDDPLLLDQFTQNQNLKGENPTEQQRQEKTQ